MFSTKRKEAFRLLGLNENATEKEIKKAYRKNALKYHPDKNNNDETASDMFKKVKEAYDTLLKKEPNIFSYEEQINIDVDDIFNMFNNMASENVFFFGPETFQKPSKKKLTFKVKINIIDTWLNKTKRLQVNNIGLIKIPLYYEKIVYEHERYNIDVKIIDKNTDIYKRKNNYDLQLVHNMKLHDAYRNHNFIIELPDTTKRNIFWKKEYIQHKKFFIYNLGLPNNNNNERGKLIIKINIVLPDKLTDIIPEDEEEKESENIEFDYSNSDKIKRNKKLKLNDYL